MKDIYFKKGTLDYVTRYGDRGNAATEIGTLIAFAAVIGVCIFGAVTSIKQGIDRRATQKAKTEQQPSVAPQKVNQQQMQVQTRILPSNCR